MDLVILLKNKHQASQKAFLTSNSIFNQLQDQHQPWAPRIEHKHKCLTFPVRASCVSQKVSESPSVPAVILCH